MKTILFGFILFFALPSFAYENDLTKSEQNALLRATNRAGLDTWHEGDFQYRYQSAGCNFTIKECWVYVEMKYQGQKQLAYCHAEDVTSFAQVFDTQKKRITDFFYDSILECMNTWPE